MYIAIMILLACLIIILVLVLIILLVPLRYQLELNFNQSVPQFNFSLYNCCYGLQTSKQEKQFIVQLRLFGFRRPLKQPTPANKSVRPGEPAPDREAFSPRLLKEIMLDSTWKKHIGGLVQGIWRIILPHRMLIKARIGFSEPHYTGWLMALAGVLQAMNHAYNIELEGKWDEPCFEGELILAGRLILIQLLWQLLKFILKPEIRSAYKRIRTQKNPSSQQQAA